MNTPKPQAELAVLLVLSATMCSAQPDAQIADLPRGETIAVAVVDFTSSDREAFKACSVTYRPMNESGSRLSNVVADKLNNWPQYRVISCDASRDLIRHSRRMRRSLHRPATLRKIGERLGVDAVLVGQTDGARWRSRKISGTCLYASMQLVSTESAEVLWSVDGSVSSTGPHPDVFPTLADEMLQRLQAQLDERRDAHLLAAVERP